MNKKNIGVRHGDVELYPIASLPEGLTEIKCNGSFVLAEGETTGHKHIIKADRLQVFRHTDGRLFLSVGDNAVVTHEEHKTLKVMPSFYEIGAEREFDWFGRVVRIVVD